MNTKIGSFLVFVLFVLALSGGALAEVKPGKKSASPGLQNYAGLWKQVDSLSALGQPRSAAEVAEKIRARAKAEKNDPQYIKSVIYGMRLNSEFQENFLVKSISGLKKEVITAKGPSRQILQSILAEVYAKYYQNNQFRFRDRTHARSIISDSLETWDLQTISSVITRTYLLSLANPDTLKRTPIDRFDAVVECYPAEPKTSSTSDGASKYYPTLYDFLAGRALDFFTENNGTLLSSSRGFEIDRPEYFAQTAAFIRGEMNLPADSASPKRFAMVIFRDLAAFHRDDNDPRALIETELKRFSFIHEMSVLPERDSLYREALKIFEKNFAASLWSADISYTLASFLCGQGLLYKPLTTDAHQWEIRSALDVCENTIKRHPGSNGAKNCQILEGTIKKQDIGVTTESAVAADKSSLALLYFANVTKLYFRLVKTDPEIYAGKWVNARPEEFFGYLAALPAATSWSQALPSENDYQKHSVEMPVPALPAGFYVLVCSTRENFTDPQQVYTWMPFWSTQVSYISRRNGDGSTGYFLLDRESGSPLGNVRTEVWMKNWDYQRQKYVSVKLQDITSDDKGYLELPTPVENGRNTNNYLKIFYRDEQVITGEFYRYPGYRSPERTSLQTMFYTDRAIYRPGQLVYFKGIILERMGNRSAIKPGQATKVVFSDANGRKITELNLVSNEFGSFNGSFTAPLGVLPGQMSIANESGSAYISVEEYKRPMFEVTYEPLEGNYKLGDKLVVTGKAAAFAGNGIDGAKVAFRVVRNARFPFFDWRNGYRPIPVSSPAEIASGTTTTGPDGKFTITFTALPDRSVEMQAQPVFDYTVTADVTDLNGETQNALQEVSVGTNSLLLSVAMTGMVNLTSDSLVKITATNLNGRPTPVVVSATLQRLRQPATAFKTRSWARPDLSLTTAEVFHAQYPDDLFADENNPENWPAEATLFQKNINTANDSVIKLFNPKTLLPGSYLLVLKANDPFGKEVVTKQLFTAFSPLSAEVPVNEMNWFVPLKTTGEPGEAARFLIGSRSDHVNLICEISRGDTLVSRETITLSNRARIFEVPILEKYRGNFSVNFAFVKHNRVFQNSTVIQVPYTDKKLAITLETFRNKIDPGTKESWKIRISKANGNPAHAEFMAGMYDASLDQFRANSWSFSLYQASLGGNPWNIDQSFQTTSGTWHGPAGNEVTYSEHPLLRLNWFGLNYFGSDNRNIIYGRGRMSKKTGIAPMAAEDAVLNEMEVASPKPVIESNVIAGSPGGTPDKNPPAKNPLPAGPELQVRRDFRETAFFYPSMVTDSTGGLILEFTAPESLTRWKLMGLAHTKNLESGQIEKELVTRKELMVFPNAPRFVRQGDTVVFSTKIVNLSDHDLSGKAALSMGDAFTPQSFNNLVKPASALDNNPLEVGFSAAKGRSAMVSWILVIPSGSALSVLQYRVTASAGSFSDGEEKAIPVLTNRLLITEPLPLPVRGKGTTEFSFDKLLKSGNSGESTTRRNYKLTLEFASNPAWYAIQALPSLDDQAYDNADAIFDAFWSNSMATFIANSSPKIRAVFESWKNLTPDALQSTLEKNQELKSALLQETPWVMDAAGETGRKQNLGRYFDPNATEARLKENMGKLLKLQTPDGGWTWFAGMPVNRYTTQNILTGLGRLHHLDITDILADQERRSMVTRAIGYLDRELAKDYENLEKYQPGHLDENNTGSSQVQYLYARSYFMNPGGTGIPFPDAKCSEAFAYFKKQAEKYWLQNDRGLQAMIALALNRLGNREVPPLILKSLSEKALHSPEMGMYWAEEQGYYWHQAPVENQALMIEAFDEAGKNEAAVEELKIWLLKQKQTQNWRSPRATLEACYALLLRGPDLLAEDPGVKISLGKEKISSGQLTDVKKEAGTGYFQCSWTGNDIRPDMGKITVSKSSQGIAWGAVYWQYFEDLDKITPAATPMKLEKKVFIERNTPAGPVLEPVSDYELKIKNYDKKTDQGTKQPNVLLKTGDRMVVRVVLTVDRDLEFVYMKDLRASALEPVISPSGSLPWMGGGSGGVLSGYRYQDGLGYYQSTTDLATSFFFDYLPKGTYVFEYALRANAAGEYSNGITTVQCMYAPEFAAHSVGIRIKIVTSDE